jgi:hypothetical protein
MKIAAALCVLIATAHAQGVEAVLTPHGDTKTIDAALIGAPKASRITLTSGEVVINATKQRPYAQSGDPIVIAFVIQADEAWAAAELATISKALDATDLAKLCPPDSFATIIAYAQDTQTKVAMGPLDRVKGRNLGVAKDYKGKKGASLATAVTMALAEVAKVEAPRKAVIVLGDGSDSDPKSPLADLKKQAASQKTELYAIVTKTGAITKLVPNAAVAKDAADVGAQLDAVAKRLTDRFYVTFPVGKLIPFDGKDHDFVVTLDKQALDKQTVTLKSPVK